MCLLWYPEDKYISFPEHPSYHHFNALSLNTWLTGHNQLEAQRLYPSGFGVAYSWPVICGAVGHLLQVLWGKGVSGLQTSTAGTFISKCIVFNKI